MPHRLILPLWLVAAVWPLGAAVLEGVVLENRSGRPLARSKVWLETVQAQGPVENGDALSDSSGRFRFLGLPAGLYRLRVQRQGYVTTRFGQRRWNGEGTPISLDADSQFFADVRMQKLGAITGEIVDENGVGLSGITVLAYRADKRPLRAAAFAATDDRGVYRIGVEPGLYYVANAAAQLEGGRGLLPTFLGQTATARDARPLEVALDQEHTVRSIEPLPGRLGTLSGTLQGGVPATIALYTETGKREVRVEPGGGFKFEGLAPGTYPLIALSEGGPARAAYVRVQVSESTQVALTLAPMTTARLRVEENGQRTTSDVVAVLLTRVEPFETFAVAVRAGETAVVPPGEYTTLAVGPSGYYVDSVRSGGPRRPDAAGEIEAFPGGTLEISVVLKSGPAQLTGKVTTPNGQPSPGAHVFIKPLDPGRRIYTGAGDRTNANSSGEYWFPSLPPGRYRIFGSFEIREPTAEDWASGGVETVTLGDNQKETLDLKLTGAL